MPDIPGTGVATTWSWIPTCSRLMSSGSAALRALANTFERACVYLHRKPLRLSLSNFLHEKISLGARHVRERSFPARPNAFAGSRWYAFGAGLSAYPKRLGGDFRRRAGDVCTARPVCFLSN